MEAAIGAASWILGKVAKQLSDDMVAAYVASTELGLNMEQINRDLMFAQGLLHEAQGRRDMSNPGLQGLLENLNKKADEAEDVLDELQYFIIQDQIDGTKEATPEVVDGLRGHTLHGHHALRHTIGNWLPCLSCSSTRDDTANHVGMLTFNRVDMSHKIKSVIEGIHASCTPVSDLLKAIHPAVGRAASLKRPPTSSTITQGKLYGRENIFNQTLDNIANCETLSVLPIVGPGGIGKTTFAQHLYNDKRTEAHFSVNKAWVSVSTKFDVVTLSQDILRCICGNKKEASSGAHKTSNLDKLQKSIEEKLESERFLLVLDDMWKLNSEAEWESLLAPFKKGGAKGIMVLVTTRFPSIAEMVKTTKPIKLQGIEDSVFSAFFEACIFGQDRPESYEADMIGIAKKISKKLKGFPLAAKSVGRLLKNNLSWEFWMEVLERNEWKNQQSDDDIMPALKISYDYLPFHLKKCFSYCALYPEDYRLSNLEITCFWEAIGIIDSEGQNNKSEIKGLKYLDELVGNGFLMKVDEDERQYYVMHDLFHELAQNVSSQECINISPQSFRFDYIPRSIRHISITFQNKYDQSFEGEMENFKRKIDIGNLRTLMFFGRYNEDIAIFFKNIFKETKRLRVLFMFANSLESFPYNFSKLVHLRYLKLAVPYGSEFSLPGALCRFYHLKFLDLSHGNYILPKDISRLVNLHHFLAKKELCSSIPGIGKLRYLQGLEKFHVKKEGTGFELRELGDLTELRGALEIINLENLATREEANDAKLALKRNLKKLTLVWGAEQWTIGSDVLDGLQPHPNLRALGIRNHGGANGPSWLCGDICVKGLKSLHLEGVSWGTLPLFGHLIHLEELTLNNIAIHQFGPDFGGVTQKSFLQLKKIELVGMPELVAWLGGAHCHLFANLASIRCVDCPNLSMLLLPYSECSASYTQDMNTIWFPNLCSLDIQNCPKLSLPPVPHTKMLTSITIIEGNQVMLRFTGETLRVDGNYNGALAFRNLDKVKHVIMKDSPHVSFTLLQKFNSLKSLEVTGCKSMLLGKGNVGVIFHLVHKFNLDYCRLTGNSLTKQSNDFQLQLSRRVEEEEALLEVAPSSILRYGVISGCKNLVLPGGGLQDLSWLQVLKIEGCGSMFSRWTMVEEEALSSKPFPASLRALDITGESSMQSMALLSNLTSLTLLVLRDCDNLTADGFDPLMTLNLKKMVVYNYPKINNNNHRYSMAADLFSMVARTKLIPAGSFQQLELLDVDTISEVLVAPVCSLLAASLCELRFTYDLRMESFREEQEQALQLLISLQCLEFYCCPSLQSLPEGLHRLSSLRRLFIYICPEITSLPKEGLPASLKCVGAWQCSTDLTEQLNKLKPSNPDLEVDFSVTNTQAGSTASSGAYS